MAGNISDQTTVLSNVSLTGNLAFDSTLNVSGTSSSRVTAATVWATSQVTTPNVSAISLQVVGGVQASGVTFDMRTNEVIPSSVTYAGGASISGLTIGQWGFVFNASGFSIAFSSGKSAYFFGGSTLSAAIT
jgi:hypothetical protein